jgi:hypothetical protein
VSRFSSVSVGVADIDADIAVVVKYTTEPYEVPTLFVA